MKIALAIFFASLLSAQSQNELRAIDELAAYKTIVIVKLDPNGTPKNYAIEKVIKGNVDDGVKIFLNGETIKSLGWKRCVFFQTVDGDYTTTYYCKVTEGGNITGRLYHKKFMVSVKELEDRVQHMNKLENERARKQTTPPPTNNANDHASGEGGK